MARIKLTLFKNRDREKDTHPQLKNGKPIEVNGQRFWVSGFINSDNPDTQASITRMLDKLEKENGSYPIISISLTPAEPQASTPSSDASGWEDDDDPF